MALSVCYVDAELTRTRQLLHLAEETLHKLADNLKHGYAELPPGLKSLDAELPRTIDRSIRLLDTLLTRRSG